MVSSIFASHHLPCRQDIWAPSSKSAAVRAHVRATRPKITMVWGSAGMSAMVGSMTSRGMLDTNLIEREVAWRRSGYTDAFLAKGRSESLKEFLVER